MLKMTTKKSSRKRMGGAVKDKQVKSVLDSAVEAMIELGQAAENIKQTLEHIQRAQKKAKPVIDPIKRAATKTMSTVRKTVTRKK